MAIGLVAVGILAGLSPAASFFAGSAVTLFNLAVLVFGWPRILAQKQVARIVFLIVFKFAILGVILYLAVNSPAIRLGWFALGLATVLPSVTVTAIMADFSSTTGDDSGLSSEAL